MTLKRMKHWLGMLALATWAATSAAEVSVTNVVVHQRYPWNGMVDIDYEVVADDPEADVWVCPNGVDADRGTMIPMLALSGDGANGAVKPGTHRMTWNADADAPEYHTRNFQVSMTAVVGASLYLVVDLSGGPEAESYPVRHSGTGPDLADDGCRTTNLWLRLVPPGTFTMGSPTNELGRLSDEKEHEVTLSEPFYLAIFECTQKQYELVMGTNPSYFTNATCYATRPVEKVSYNSLRGTLAGANWPAHRQVDEESFFGKLRSRTALEFDLPTEAQWEYACRAGTTTALNNGMNLTATNNCTNLSAVGRYQGNRSSSGSDSSTTDYGTAEVGSCLPNAWGFYDMHGNVWEWCLDRYASNLGTAAVTDPEGASSNSNRVRRGGSWASDAQACRSAYRNDPKSPSTANTSTGFRPALALPR